MSIAFSPNAFAVIAICERVYRSSRRDDVRMIDVSAQSGLPKYHTFHAQDLVRHSQSSAANCSHDEFYK